MPQQVTLRFPPAASPADLPEAELRFAAARQLGLAPGALAALAVRKISFDARPRHMSWQVVAEVWAAGELLPPAPDWSPQPSAPPPPDAAHVVVIGGGPAGLFCALDLLRAGLRVTLLERGKEVQARRRDLAAIQRGEPADLDSNYCFGEGGAGTFSDGKLYTRSGTREEVRAVLEELVRHGAPAEILVSWRPHIGSNRLPKVVETLRETLQRGGAVLRFQTRAVRLESAAGRVRAVHTAAGERLAADAVVLATGHSALDALDLAQEAGALLEAKGFAMGVRIEHPQAWLDRHQYHGARDFAALPPAFYELSTESGGSGVYSFCMCPGGWIVPSMVDDRGLVVNGMSLSKRDSPYANSGLVVAITPEDWCGARGGRWGWPELLRRAASLSAEPLLAAAASGRLPERPGEDPRFGLRIQRALEVVAAAAGGGGHRAPAQRADLFLAGSSALTPPLPSSYHPGLTAADLGQVLPRGMVTRLRGALAEFQRRIPGFAGEQGQLVGVETRTSSPVRIARSAATLESPGVAGLLPCGEGAGFAGGIVSAILDGRRIAAAAARYVGQPALSRSG